jgi:hypothetical protein
MGRDEYERRAAPRRRRSSDFVLLLKKSRFQVAGKKSFAEKGNPKFLRAQLRSLDRLSDAPLLLADGMMPPAATPPLLPQHTAAAVGQHGAAAVLPQDLRDGRLPASAFCRSPRPAGDGDARLEGLSSPAATGSGRSQEPGAVGGCGNRQSRGLS